MTADNPRVTDSLDNVHHEIDRVWLSVIGEQLVLEKEPTNPRVEFAVAVMKDCQIVGHILINYLQITWYLETLHLILL